MCPFTLQTFSLTVGEKRGHGPSKKEPTGASEIDKHQLAGNTNPPNPFKIFTSLPPATATQCQRQNQCTIENCVELLDLEKGHVLGCFLMCFCGLYLANGFCFYLPGQLVGSQV